MIVPLLLAGLVMVGQFCGSEKVINPETGRAARVALSSEQEEALGLQSALQTPATLQDLSFTGGAGRWEVRRTRFFQGGSPHDLLAGQARSLVRLLGRAAVPADLPQDLRGAGPVLR